MKRTLIVLIGLAIAGGAAWWYVQHRRQQEWKEVDRALTRLEAGIEHESTIALRSTVANAAAALENYKKETGRSDEPRVLAAQRAIEHLDYALQQSSAADRLGLGALTHVTVDKWPRYGVPKLAGIGEGVTCGSNGIPYIFEGVIREAHLVATRVALLEARSNMLTPVTPLDPERETVKCQQDVRDEAAKEAAEVAAKKSAAASKAEAHRRAFPLHVDVKGLFYAPGTFIWIDGERWEYDFSEGHEEHIDAMESVKIDARYSFSVPLGVKVNGRNWGSSRWVPVDGLKSRRQTTITVPEAQQLLATVEFPLRLELSSSIFQTVSVYVDGAERPENLGVEPARSQRVNAQDELRLMAYRPGQLSLKLNGAAWSPKWERVGQFSTYYHAHVTASQIATAPR